MQDMLGSSQGPRGDLRVWGARPALGPVRGRSPGTRIPEPGAVVPRALRNAGLRVPPSSSLPLPCLSARPTFLSQKVPIPGRSVAALWPPGPAPQAQTPRDSGGWTASFGPPSPAHHIVPSPPKCSWSPRNTSEAPSSRKPTGLPSSGSQQGLQAKALSLVVKDPVGDSLSLHSRGAPQRRPRGAPTWCSQKHHAQP